MLYRCLKFIVRLASLLFFRKIIINQRHPLSAKGPVLIACNHPNSFLDAILLDILFEQPVWSLARGDVFKNSFISRLLLSLRMLPVYRVSEGVENLNSNYETFKACKNIFRKKGLVLIFSEGKCINEWHLRPLKKGTARLALSSWEEDIPLVVLPAGLNYSSFRQVGKNVVINFGQPITQKDIPAAASEGLRIQALNALLNQQLQQAVYEIPKQDLAKRKQLLGFPTAAFTRVLLFLPAVSGWLLHFPLYVPLKHFVLKKTSHNDHYDSILFALLIFIYPVYLLAITVVLFIFTHTAWSLLVLTGLPALACSYIHYGHSLK